MAYLGNNVTTQASTPTVDYFSGNGSTTAFTLSRPVVSAYVLEVIVNNVQQNPSSAFSVAGQIITFTEAPSTGTNNIYVIYNGGVSQQIGIGQGTVLPASLGGGNPPQWDSSGNLSVVGKLTIGTPFIENPSTITKNYVVTTGSNAMTAGPITVNNGVVVTVPNGSTWTIV